MVHIKIRVLECEGSPFLVACTFHMMFLAVCEAFSDFIVKLSKSASHHLQREREQNFFVIIGHI